MMSELVTCSGCSREWDGYAQCPCGGYQEQEDQEQEEQEEEDSQELDNIRKFRGPMKGSGGWWCSSLSRSGPKDNESWSFLLDKNEDVSFLSGEQIEKGLLLQIGSVNGLTKDIMIYIFNIMTSYLIYVSFPVCCEI